MTDYIKFALTAAGERIMARIIGGETVTFKRIAIGDGYDYDLDNFRNRTDLVNEVLSLTNLTMQITDTDEVLIKSRFSSSDLQQSFWYREIGLFIVDPDDEDEEILYGYGNLNDQAQYITPDVSNYGVLKEENLYVKCGRSANVNIYISGENPTQSISFVSGDWTLNTTTGLYELTLGAVGEVINVFKVNNTTRTLVPGADILKDSTSTISTLRALAAFDGIAIAI